MDVVEYGRTPEGVPCCLDAYAAAADAVVVLARVKSHTSFDRPIETPVANLRPAQETCEGCHWPDVFLGQKLVTRNSTAPTKRTPHGRSASW